jgi:protein-L-isoaspartate(D-aspartate) O-methyltransferase
MDDFMTLRSRLVECLMRHSGHNDVNPLDEKVLSIMSHVPRHIFVPQELLKYAYANEALSLPCGQAISQPFVVAWMSSLLKLDTADNVLEIGTGSGYQTAILAEMAPQGRIVTFERYPELSRYARARIRQLTIRNVVFVVGDGTLGCLMSKSSTASSSPPGARHGCRHRCSSNSPTGAYSLHPLERARSSR